jgi:thiamine biosynthesis protein ThiI
VSLFIVRYSEIGLKGQNRSFFEEALVRNIRDRLRGLAGVKVERRRGRVLVHAPGAPAPALRAIEEGLGDTPGIRTWSPARAVALEMPAIEAAAAELARDFVAARPPGSVRTFRVEASRSEKRFPLTSMQVDAQVGGAVLAAVPELKVKLVGQDLTVGIEIQPGEAFVLSEWRDGPGGLPVGSSGPVALLLSGGIDSPVAGMLLQKRGCTVAPVYCHAFPFTGDAAKEKVLDLARALARRQATLDLRIAQIAEAQTQLRDRCRPDLLVVLYRRLMVRICERVAEEVRADALATGENLGQVASQTLPNMRAIDAAATRPILRPLATNDKEETIALARRLGTYEISVRPADDCCQLFVPKHPATRVRLEEVLAEEAKVDVAAMVETCCGKVEVVRFRNGEVAGSRERTTDLHG